MKVECRPFRVSDAIILVAAIGIGLGWLVALSRSEINSRFPVWTSWNSPLYSLGTIISWIVVVCPPMLVSLSAGILVVRFRRPRPRWRRMGREPGAIACLIAFLAWILSATAFAAFDIANRIAEGFDIGVGWVEYPLCSYPSLNVGLCVGIAWLAQWLGRVWRPSACWIDRFGRAVGLGWIMVFIAEHLKYDLLSFARMSV